MRTVNLPVIIPEWATFIAVNVDGNCFTYAIEPVLNPMANGWEAVAGTRTQFLAEIEKPKHGDQTCHTVDEFVQKYSSALNPFPMNDPCTESALAKAVEQKLSETVTLSIPRPFYQQDQELDFLASLSYIAEDFIEDGLTDEERRRVVAWFNDKFGG